MEVICTIAIMLSGGYRDYPQLHGIVLKDGGDYWLVDFSKEFEKRHIKTNKQVWTLEHETGPARLRMHLQTPVQRVHGNDCLYVNPPKEWLE